MIVLGTSLAQAQAFDFGCGPTSHELAEELLNSGRAKEGFTSTYSVSPYGAGQSDSEYTAVGLYDWILNKTSVVFFREDSVVLETTIESVGTHFGATPMDALTIPHFGNGGWKITWTLAEYLSGTVINANLILEGH